MDFETINFNQEWWFIPPLYTENENFAPPKPNIRCLQERANRSEMFIYKGFKESEQRRFEREKEVYKKLNRRSKPNFFLKLIGTYTHRELFNNSYVFGLILPMIIKRACLEDCLKRKRAFTESEVLEIFNQLLKAVRFLHAVNIIHGDINPKNIMVFFGAYGGIQIKLFDFDCSISLGIGQEQILINEMPGCTEKYAADVLLQQHDDDARYDPLQTDLFALAMTILEIIGFNLNDVRKSESRRIFIRDLLILKHNFRFHEALSDIFSAMLDCDNEKITGRALLKKITAKVHELNIRSKIDFVPSFSDVFHQKGQEALELQEAEENLNHYDYEIPEIIETTDIPSFL